MKTNETIESETFSNVWDALEVDPVKRENLKIRSKLMMTINEKIDELGKNQTELAEIFNTTQPRVSALRKNKISDFRLDALVDFAVRLGLHVSLNVAA